MNAPETETTLIPLLTVDEAAAYAKCHRETILRMIRRGDLAALKVGTTYRISANDFKPTRREKPVVQTEELGLKRFASREWRNRQASAIPYGIRGNESPPDRH